MVLNLSVKNKKHNKEREYKMKKFGLTLLTAFIGGAMALGAYKIVENKYAANMSFEDKQKVYFEQPYLAGFVIGGLNGHARFCAGRS